MVIYQGLVNYQGLLIVKELSGIKFYYYYITVT